MFSIVAGFRIIFDTSSGLVTVGGVDIVALIVAVVVVAVVGSIEALVFVTVVVLDVVDGITAEPR